MCKNNNDIIFIFQNLLSRRAGGIPIPLQQWRLHCQAGPATAQRWQRYPQHFLLQWARQEVHRYVSEITISNTVQMHYTTVPLFGRYTDKLIIPPVPTLWYLDLFRLTVWVPVCPRGNNEVFPQDAATSRACTTPVKRPSPIVCPSTRKWASGTTWTCSRSMRRTGSRPPAWPSRRPQVPRLRHSASARLRPFA